jgi:hypothetical protein
MAATYNPAPLTTWTRGAELGAGYRTRRPVALSFARIVANVAAMVVGTDTTFAVGAAHVWAWMPRRYTWVISLIEVAPDFSEMAILRTIGICPGGFRSLEAVRTLKGGELDGAPCVADDFWSAEAAVGFALDYVIAPVLANGQHDHDPFAV